MLANNQDMNFSFFYIRKKSSKIVKCIKKILYKNAFFVKKYYSKSIEKKKKTNIIEIHSKNTAGESIFNG